MQQYKHVIHNLVSMDQYNVLAFDVIGCGTSPKPHNGGWFGLDDTYSLPNLHAYNVAVFEKYATKENVLIGHSFGTCQVARIHNSWNIDTQNRPNDDKRVIKGCILLGTAAHKDMKHAIFRWYFI